MMKGRFGKRIALTKTAEILEYFVEEKKYVVKLFHEMIPDELVRCEFETTQLIAEQTELTIAKCHGLIQHNNRTGIILDYISGNTVTTQLFYNPFSLNKLIQLLVSTQLKINTSKVDGLASFEQRLALSKNKIITKKIIEHSKHISKTSACLCHGDFHFKNIVLSQSKVVYTIDWMDAHIGNPCYDVCKTYILFKMPSPSNHILYHQAVRPLKKHIANKYLEMYLSKSDLNKDDIFVWLPVVIEVLKVEGLSKYQLKWLEKEVSR